MSQNLHWKAEDLLKTRVGQRLFGKDRPKSATALMVPQNVTPVTQDGHTLEFVVKVLPMGAVRMNRSDAWKKRPCVLRYRSYRDALRRAVGSVAVPDELHVEAYLPMPPSWSKKKQARMNGMPHQYRPDRDNIDKGVGDALWDEDSAIWKGSQIKRWCLAGDERLCLRLVYHPKKPA